jgi:electron transfer flavoprotein alpha subunit
MKKILIYLEPQKDGLKRVSYELITAAKSISEKTSASFTGFLINGTENQAKTAGEYGLTEILLAKNDLYNDYSSPVYAEAIAQAAMQEGADCILFPANSAGMELAPRVAVKMEAGYIADCVALNYNDGILTVKKPVYAGKAQISTKITTANQVYSLRPNVFTAVKSDVPSQLNIKEFAVNISSDLKKVFVTKQVKNEGKLDVLEADVIVSGGRGIKAPENYQLIENLASVLHGAVGASRAVVDAGWRPHSEQVGQTGKTVSPTMYIACGISGAVQHLAGMSTSKIIIAINKDKDAPIFKVCDYGIVGDLFNVLPKFTENVKMIAG